jgi:hypothetical protein
VKKNLLAKIRFISIAIALTVLAVALSSCGGGNGDSDPIVEELPVQISTDEFWEELFLSSSIPGIAPVDLSKDLYFSFYADIAVGVDGNLFGLNVEIALIIDRTSRGADTGKNTALKLSLNGAAGAFTVYYFLADPGNIYLEADGGKYALPFETGVEDAFPDMVNGLLTNYPLIGGNSVSDLADLYAGPYGNAYRFIPALLRFVTDSGLLEAVGFSGTGDNFIDGLINQVLSGGENTETLIKTIARLLCENGSATVTAGCEYEITLSKVFNNILISALPDLKQLLGDNAVFKVRFSKKAAATGAPLTGLSINASIPGYGADKDKELNAEISLSLPRIAETDAAKAAETLGKTDEYGDLAINLEFAAEIPEEMIKLTLFDKLNSDYIYNGYDIKGRYTVTGTLSLNLSDVKKTVLKGALNKNGASLCEIFFTANSDTEGVLIIKFDKSNPDSENLGRVFADYVLSYRYSADIVARFMNSYEFAVTGIALRTLLPVWTGPKSDGATGGEATGGEATNRATGATTNGSVSDQTGADTGENSGPADITSDPRLAVSLKTFLDRRFINGLLKSLLIKDNSLLLSLPSMGDAIVSMIYPDVFSSLAEFCSAVYLDGNYYQNGAETAEFLDELASLFRGSVFSDGDDNGGDFLFKLLSASLTVSVSQEHLLASLTYGGKTASLSIAISFGGSVSLPFTPPSAGAAIVQAPFPLVDWTSLVSW